MFLHLCFFIAHGDVSSTNLFVDVRIVFSPSLLTSWIVSFMWDSGGMGSFLESRGCLIHPGPHKDWAHSSRPCLVRAHRIGAAAISLIPAYWAHTRTALRFYRFHPQTNTRSRNLFVQQAQDSITLLPDATPATFSITTITNACVVAAHDMEEQIHTNQNLITRRRIKVKKERRKKLPTWQCRVLWRRGKMGA